MKSISCGKEYTEDVRNINIRPEQLDDFVGQKDLIQNLKVFINAAQTRTEALDHVLFVRSSRAWQNNFSTNCL